MNEVERLRKALQFYADRRNYHREWQPIEDITGDWHYANSVLDNDFGRIAEEALRKDGDSYAKP